MDREEFYRLKKVSGKKQRDAAEKEATDAANKKSDSDKENAGEEGGAETRDMLGDQDNEDVIF